MALSEMSEPGRVDSGPRRLVCVPAGCLTLLPPSPSLTCHPLTPVASSIAISGLGSRMQKGSQIGPGLLLMSGLLHVTWR